jgi:hypothetical protein
VSRPPKADDANADLEQLIQRRPLYALTLSAGAGFMLGGGLRSRLGLALGLLIGRTLASLVVVSVIEAASDQNGKRYQQNP